MQLHVGLLDDRRKNGVLQNSTCDAVKMRSSREYVPLEHVNYLLLIYSSPTCVSYNHDAHRSATVVMCRLQLPERLSLSP